MSKKDVDKHYQKILEQYTELKQNLKDFEEEAKKGLFPPEKMDEIKANIRPLMDNYERWSYMMFLLNQPAKKEKRNKYAKQNEKFLKSLNDNNSIESTLQAGKDVIHDMQTKK